MVDLSQTIAAKSDQLNADDLMGGPRTIRITGVRGNSDKEQPISIYYQGDGGKPYKPGKSMRRVLVNFWGKDGEAYAGRSMTLFRDPAVEFGGIKVGGIRISHMSHLDGETDMALAVTRGAKRRYSVKHLHVEQDENGIDAARSAIADAETIADLERVWKMRAMAPHRDALRDDMEKRKAALSEPETGRADADHGDQHPGTEDEHPARPLVDDTIFRCERAQIIGDVIGAESDFARHREAVPEDMVAEVDRAVEAAKARIKGGAGK